MLLDIGRVEIEEEGIAGCFFFLLTIFNLEADSLALIFLRDSRYKDIRNDATSPRWERIEDSLLQKYNLSKVVMNIIIQWWITESIIRVGYPGGVASL